ncbi:tRNA A64-2'-O-ribosylphosphate transferase [Gautieria morchelliformis]|nr:tRNA A64-2'-O-ribosylphosphate transferase [Gautieria morchelliformis]
MRHSLTTAPPVEDSAPPVDDSLARETTHARREIRQESNDAYNRLHSIAEDAAFISRMAHLYPTFKMYPNLRCGAWYVEPKLGQREPVYFKSTDGHFGQWAFNLRRANLHLLDAITQCGGVILVDSTRRGKRFPDALSKTVPIWCAVINLAVAKRSNGPSWTAMESKENYGLYTPSGSVSRSEHSQMESRLDEWAEKLLSSEYSIPCLPKPLRPIWITADTQTILPLDSLDVYPVVCVSASRLVQEGIERRSAGYTYVQGSGDDHESWSQGLTPELYWQNHTQILAASRSTLSVVISSLVASTYQSDDFTGSPILVPVIPVKSRLAVGMAHSMPSLSALSSMSGRKVYVFMTSQPGPLPAVSSCRILLLQTTPGKKGQHKLLTDVLPQSLHFIRHHLVHGEDIAVVCNDGKDISVGVAVAALCLFFDDEGVCVANTNSPGTPTKDTVRKRLQWILANNPQANPSRTTLKRVNEYLMSQPRHLDATLSAVEGDLESSFNA